MLSLVRTSIDLMNKNDFKLRNFYSYLIIKTLRYIPRKLIRK